MAPSDPTGREEWRALLVRCLEDPSRSREHLPALVGLFDADEPVVRLCGAWACAVVATEAGEEAVEYLVRRLSDRLDGEVSLELTTTLDYLSNRYPEQVEHVLDGLGEGSEVPLPAVGNFTRNHYYGTDLDRDGIGRSRVPEGGTDPRLAYGDTGDDEPGRGTARGDEGDTDTEEAIERQPSEISDVANRSRFDDLHILAARDRTRYAERYDSLVGQGGSERAVTLRLLRRPAEGRASYRDRIQSRLGQWEAVGDHDHVVPVFDWGIDPRAWLATGSTGESLLERGRRPLRAALADVEAVTDALAYCHRNGVVHGGLDPGNVVYGTDRAPETVLIDNVGLVEAFRFQFDPAMCLDPRYAAPEYFDERYGGIDHASDIYGVGAILYRLVTGRPPYTGSFEEVRAAVLGDSPPRPGEVVEVPAALDELVSKAMAREKLTRYETVENLATELSSLTRGEPDG